MGCSEVKRKGVKVRCKVSVWRSARPEPSYLKLMAVRAGVSAEDLLGCVFAARPPSTASLLTSYVRHNTTYLYSRSPPGQILNYNWTSPAKKSRLSIADHTLVAFWKHGSTVLQMPSSWAVQTLLATMSQLPCGHLRRCGGCTALLVQLDHSKLLPPSLYPTYCTTVSRVSL